jgi:hypothetical protein
MYVENNKKIYVKYEDIGPAILAASELSKNLRLSSMFRGSTVEK